jgi:hypothetical protein
MFTFSNFLSYYYYAAAAAVPVPSVGVSFDVLKGSILIFYTRFTI